MTDTCPVCGSADISAMEYRPDVPVLMNRLYRSQETARTAKRGTLEMMVCKSCGFAWNRAFDPNLIAYDDSYENDQTHSSTFLAHVKACARKVVAAVPAGEPIDYLEIGCGQGGFIGEVALAAGTRLRSANGFDPAWRGTDGEGPNGSRIHKVYFDARTAGRLRHRPNVVVTRHTIEHVPDPLAFLTAIRQALGSDSQAFLFVETPCVAWILAHEAIQDLFYEHCSIFTAQALSFALAKSGFQVVKLDHVFGGQYLWAESRAAGSVEVARLAQTGLRDFTGARERFVSRWRAAVVAAHSAGPVAIWGAGAKGVTFALLVDPENSLIDHVVDINPSKQGFCLAGSGLSVLSPQASALRAPKTLFVMNPNYLGEIRQLAAEVGIHGQLIPID